MADGTQYCTFWVGSLYLGIDVHRVQEVMRMPELTPVPLASASVCGLINLRGQIVTAIDLRRRLGVPSRRDDREPMNVVMRTDDGAVSLVVDEIGDVITLDETAFERVPDTLQGDIRALIRGVCKLDGQLLLLLDVGLTASLEPSSASVS